MSTPRKDDEAHAPVAKKPRKSPAGRKLATRKAPAAAAPGEDEQTEESPSRRDLTVKTTLYLPREISEGCRDAVIYLAGHPEYLTLTTLIERALRNELDRLQTVYTEGKPFPQRRRELRAGRPFGS